MISRSNFPTELHEQAAELASEFFLARIQVDTVLIVNSVARGQALPQSDLDMAVLVDPSVSGDEIERLTAQWLDYAANHPLVHQLAQANRFGHIHLDVIDGRFVAAVWDDGGGPDAFELGIGNAIAYSAPLHEPGRYFHQLQAQWLPFYDETLRRDRLSMVRAAALYDLEHVPFFVGRGLYFQAFDRLYKAFQEFLQALFIARRTYALAYNKWIRMQIVDWLASPELYRELPPILSVRNIESAELEERARSLRLLIEEWT